MSKEKIVVHEVPVEVGIAPDGSPVRWWAMAMAYAPVEKNNGSARMNNSPNAASLTQKIAHHHQCDRLKQNV